jgi:hypothetical protein
MNNRENIEQMLARENSLDYIRLTESVFLNKRNKCGKITNVSETETTSVFDTIELLYLEEFSREYPRKACGSTGSGLFGQSQFTPMYQDFFLVQSTRSYLRGQATSSGTNFTGYATIGSGIYYHRTNYIINEDESYYYITSKFDIYTNTMLDQITNLYNATTTQWLSSEIPRCYEEDNEFAQFLTSLEQSGISNGTRQTTRGILDTPRNRNRIIEWLQLNRIPRIRSRAMDIDNGVVRSRDGLTTCVAIKKGITQPLPHHYNTKKRRDTCLTHKISTNDTIIQGQLGQMKTWLNSSMETNMLRLQQQESDTREREMYKERVIVTTNTFSKRKNDKMFHGILDTEGRYEIANIISTSNDVDIGEQLLRLIKNKTSDTVYPTTEKMSLLNSNAFVSTYNTPELKANKIDIPGLFGSLSLQREGDYDGFGNSSILLDYAQLDGGVYKINLPYNMTLRMDRKVGKLNSGTYAVCINKTDADIIHYMESVVSVLGNITVEPIIGRLSMGSKNAHNVHVSRQLRPLSLQAELKPKADRPTARRSVRKILGTFLMKEVQEEEE